MSRKQNEKVTIVTTKTGTTNPASGVPTPVQGKRNRRRNRNKTNQANADSVFSSPPVTVGGTIISRGPKQQATRNSIRVQNRELLSGSIKGSATFTNQLRFNLNPGLSTTFPWLSTLAQNWEQYKFYSVSIEWVPIASTSTQGDVMVVPDYDPTDASYLDENSALNVMGATAFPVWQPTRIVLNDQGLTALGPRRYIRDQLQAGDLHTYDSGQVQIFTNNFTTVNPVGKLFISYDVELYIPQSVKAVSIPKQYSMFGNTSPGYALTTDGVWHNTPFSLVYNPFQFTLSDIFGVNQYQTITPFKGVYYVRFVAQIQYDINSTAVGRYFQVRVLLNGAQEMGTDVGIDTVASYYGSTSYQLSTGNHAELISEGIAVCDGTTFLQFQMRDLSGSASNAFIRSSIIISPA